MHQIVKNTHLKYTPKAILNQTQTKYKNGVKIQNIG